MLNPSGGLSGVQSKSVVVPSLAIKALRRRVSSVGGVSNPTSIEPTPTTAAAQIVIRR